MLYHLRMKEPIWLTCWKPAAHAMDAHLLCLLRSVLLMADGFEGHRSSRNAHLVPFIDHQNKNVACSLSGFRLLNILSNHTRLFKKGDAQRRCFMPAEILQKSLAAYKSVNRSATGQLSRVEIKSTTTMHNTD